MHAKKHIGFEYELETVLDGKVVHTQKVHNLVPIEGMNYLLSTGLKAGTAFPAFYFGLYEGAYDPDEGDTAATLPGAATELTAYAETTRVPLVLGAVAGGAVDNLASPAVFTGNTASKQAAGAFITSAPAKGATTGVLLSVARFPSLQPLGVGAVLRVKGPFTITSIS